MGDPRHVAQDGERRLGFGVQVQRRAIGGRRKNLHRQPAGEAAAPAQRRTLRDQRGAERQRRQERHHRDHHVERRRALLARQDADRTATRDHSLGIRSSTRRPSTSRISRAPRAFDQRAIVGGDQHRGAQPVQFAEQADQPRADLRIDIARRLVGDQKIGPRHHGARDGDALLFAAGQGRRIGAHAIAEPHPGEQLLHVAGIVVAATSRQPKRQGDIVEGGEMIEQAKILEHHADAPAQSRKI